MVAPSTHPVDLTLYTDLASRSVIFQFPANIGWIGLGINDAMAFRNAIDAKIKEIEAHVRKHPTPASAIIPKPQSNEKNTDTH